MSNSKYAIVLCQKLIQKESITPKNSGALELIIQELKPLGFECFQLPYGEGDELVHNLYAQRTPKNFNPDKNKNFCFAGHTDVVPPGDTHLWQYNPFGGTIENDILYGRGAVDMKSSIACFIAALKEFLNKIEPSFRISLLITGDEEGEAVNGTVKILPWLEEKKIKLNYCLLGEPTSYNKFGDEIKIGRRGSANFTLTIFGKQGHVAYSEKAKNPITSLIKTLDILKEYELDNGSKYFQPSNLEFTRLAVDNKINNIIPSQARARFNIRFNDQHTGDSLSKLIYSICKQLLGNNFKLTYKLSGNSFITEAGDFANLIQESIFNITKTKAKFTTTGGTSDARFIHKYCETVEFGPLNTLAHKIDESIPIKDIKALTDIYKNILEQFEEKIA